MKQFCKLIMLPLLLVACNRLTTNDWIADELNGSVKQIITTTGEAIQQDDTLRFGRYTYKEVVSYDKKGLKTQAKTLNDDGSVNLICKYEHDKQGNMIVADMRDADDKPMIRNVFEYDENGFLIKTTSIDADNHTDMTILYENDSAGNQVKQTVYDHLGRVVYSETKELPADSLSDAHYDYDAQGNWTRKIVYHSDSLGNEFPTFMWIRIIEYYK